jgi:hypothetical protein
MTRSRRFQITWGRGAQNSVYPNARRWRGWGRLLDLPHSERGKTHPLTAQFRPVVELLGMTHTRAASDPPGPRGGPKESARRDVRPSLRPPRLGQWYVGAIPRVRWRDT